MASPSSGASTSCCNEAGVPCRRRLRSWRSSWVRNPQHPWRTLRRDRPLAKSDTNLGQKCPFVEFLTQSCHRVPCGPTVPVAGPERIGSSLHRPIGSYPEGFFDPLVGCSHTATAQNRTGVLVPHAPRGLQAQPRCRAVHHPPEKEALGVLAIEVERI